MRRVVKVGEKLELGFPVKAVCRSERREVPFSDLLTRRTIVSVHMKNNTPSCDRQLASLAAHAAEFDRAGYNVVALSRDTVGSHERYAAAKGITFTLVSDSGDQFARAAGSMVEKSMYGRKFLGPKRVAFVLDARGVVLALVEKVDSTAHADQLRALINTL